MLADSDEILEMIEKEKSKTVIVEGKRDKVALEKLGFINVVKLKGPLFEFCELISEENAEVIILTDLDKEGKKLYSGLKDNFEKNKVKVDDRLRNFLFRKTCLKHIEGFDSYIENLKTP